MQNIKILNREGNKFRYKEKLIALFPSHTLYIEPFFGTGSIFFNKKEAHTSLLNDSSKFIFNLWSIFRNKDDIESLYNEIDKTIICIDILKAMLESDNIHEKVASQLLLHTVCLYGLQTTLRMCKSNSKKILLQRMQDNKNEILNKLSIQNTIISNCDVFSFLNSVQSSDLGGNAFAYIDPPYAISKGTLKDNKGWNLEKLERLIIKLKDMRINFGISEFDDNKVIDLFKKYGLHINFINKSTGISAAKSLIKNEILATNYLVDNLNNPTQEKLI